MSVFRNLKFSNFFHHKKDEKNHFYEILTDLCDSDEKITPKHL